MTTINTDFGITLKAPYQRTANAAIIPDEATDGETMILTTPNDWLNALQAGRTNWHALQQHEGFFGSALAPDFEALLTAATAGTNFI